MLESSKLDRAKFCSPGEQNKFILQVREKASVTDIATLCGCAARTIRTWKNEDFLMRYQAVEIICATYKINFPKIKRVSRSEQNRLAGQQGGSRTFEKYGRVPVDEAYRKKMRQQWWEDEGQEVSLITRPLEILYPKKGIPLAEFVGIVLGDGGITDSQLSITLNSIDDLAYSKFVGTLCERLFKVTPSVYIRSTQNTLIIMISRVALIRFLTGKLGLVTGNKVKHQVAIPDWIMAKKSYQVACLRGLVDTDGSIFTHRYSVNGKQYAYKKLSFTSASTPLRNDVHKILGKLGMRPRFAGVFDVRLDSKADMHTYFKVVSSSNPKHLKRYKK
jgi:hypothetical protein